MKQVSIRFSNLSEIRWNEFSLSSHQLTDGTAIWRVPTINLPENKEIQYEKYLSVNERVRAARYVSVSSRNEFIITRAVLRLLLSKYLNKPTDNIEITTIGNNSKPFINFPDNSKKRLQFNVSHSGAWSLIVIGSETVGIDIEKINKNFFYTDVMISSFSREEQFFVETSRNKEASFYTIWSRKESLLKGIGTGLVKDIHLITCLSGIQQFEESILKDSTIRKVGSFFVDESHIGSVAVANKIKLDSLLFYHYRD